VSVILDATGRKTPLDLNAAWAISHSLELLDLRPVDLAAISGYSETGVSEARKFARAFPLAAVKSAAAESEVSLEALASTRRGTLRRLAKEPDSAARLELLLSTRDETRKGSTTSPAAAGKGEVVRVDMRAGCGRFSFTESCVAAHRPLYCSPSTAS
jgi:hypothetical protein